ncbi:hypothetical protein [Paucibacter sp. Y2R2-4]|uniref:hypothetical protein n=1 Tax=Paucibacter sp. Y2R2-4 TaxID=2893553 RepID=UPI0021E46F80|nr:hypothetical protein [Paucibacter sp. Y2R2-4]MCV2349314.1 hypothetical protein [Paucibacter sp. Y2R2-4]
MSSTKTTARQLVLAAVQAAGPLGLGLNDLERQLANPDTGLTRHQLNLTANRLVSGGVAYKVGVGAKSSAELRWFANLADAQAWVARPDVRPGLHVGQRAQKPAVTRNTRRAPRASPSTLSRNDKTLSEVLFKRRETEARDAAGRAAKRAALDAVEPIITPHTKRTVLPSPPAHRYAVTGPVVGGFASAPIGCHEQPASSWVLAVTGGRV